ncbi:hypothetical protein SETIT_2G282500v2 [Setaria italica]|uniref:Uncharacterized protein n=1 Tax=Setaria italica TaxID=4555 RepID=A0A368Q3M0_SETIT|nr:hypothetical protein SETIT_2G282500v2 [Setaria italica]
MSTIGPKCLRRHPYTSTWHAACMLTWTDEAAESLGPHGSGPRPFFTTVSSSSPQWRDQQRRQGGGEEIASSQIEITITVDGMHELLAEELGGAADGLVTCWPQRWSAVSRGWTTHVGTCSARRGSRWICNSASCYEFVACSCSCWTAGFVQKEQEEEAS